MDDDLVEWRITRLEQMLTFFAALPRVMLRQHDIDPDQPIKWWDTIEGDRVIVGHRLRR